MNFVKFNLFKSAKTKIRDPISKFEADFNKNKKEFKKDFSEFTEDRLYLPTAIVRNEVKTVKNKIKIDSKFPSPSDSVYLNLSKLESKLNKKQKNLLNLYANRFEQTEHKEQELVEPLVTNGNFKCEIRLDVFKGTWDYIYSLSLHLIINTVSLDFIHKSISDLDNVEFVYNNVYVSLYNDGKLPQFYHTFSRELKYKNPIFGPVILAEGDIFYLPKNLEQADKRKKVLGNIRTNFPKSSLLYIDLEYSKFVYTNSKADITKLDITGYSKPSLENIAKVFNKTVNSVFFVGVGSLSYYSLLSTVDFADLKNYNDVLLKDLDKKLLEKYTIEVKQHYIKKMNVMNPVNYFKIMGIITLITNNINRIDKILKKVEKKREAFNQASSDDLEAIPALRKDLNYLPHQAEAIPKLMHAEDTAVIDIGTGGGKTITMISDSLSLVGKGVSRPLFVMPNSIVSQWISEIKFFTDNQINVVPITSETFGNWDEGKLRNLCVNAPINTFFITTFSFLVLNNEVIKEDKQKTYIFPNVNWILEYIAPKSLYIDESHLIKNPGSMRNRACVALRNIPYRRIATGTLISNNPQDLIGQLQVLDPSIVGNKREFAEKYAYDYTKSGVIRSYLDNAADLIRRDLHANSYYVKYTEKDWAASLPRIKYSKHFVEMKTDKQKLIYLDVVKNTINEILNDPKLREAWKKFTSSNNDEEESITSAALLGKLAKLEQFLTGPDKFEFVKAGLAEQDKLSPKIEKIDELIGKTIKDGSKVIVATHYNHSARHLLENSKYKDVAVFYNASRKDNILKFIKDDKIKVVFSVVQSITEGLNLQMANRIIIADVDWTSGKLKQLIARIYRPHMGKDAKGKLVNLNKNKTVFIDTVLVQGSADIVKYMFQTYKKLFNSAIVDDSPIEVPGRPDFSIESLNSSLEQLGGEKTVELDNQYNDWFTGVVEKQRKLVKEPTLVKTKRLEGSKFIDTPWVVGQSLPVDLGEIPLDQWLKKEDLNLKDKITEARNLLKSKMVKTEYGPGRILGVYSKTIKIVTGDGETVNIPHSLVIIKEKGKTRKATTKVNKTIKLVKKNATETVKDKELQTKVEDTTKTVRDKNITLNIMEYNKVLSLYADLEDADSPDLRKFGFIYQGPFYYIKVSSKNRGMKILENLLRKYDIPRPQLNKCVEILDEIRKSKHTPETANIRDFVKIKHRKAKPGQLKLYPAIEDNTVYFVYDIKTHPGIKLPRFEEELGYWYKLCGKGRNECKKVVNKINKEYVITNQEELKEDAKFFNLNLNVLLR